MIVPMGDQESMRKLSEAGVGEDELLALLNRLTLGGRKASPRVLASYPDLYALDRLGQANLGIDLSHNQVAGDVRALFQSVEVSMLNIRDLAGRVTRDVADGRLNDAEEKYRWISALHQTLHALSIFSTRINLSGVGCQISISHSPNFAGCLDDLQILFRSLQEAGLLESSRIGSGNISDSDRNLTHQAFVDSTYSDVWMNYLHNVNIPGVQLREGENETAFYERFVGTKSIDLAVNELNQKGDNFFRQFRAYHQLSEIVAAQANSHITRAIRETLLPQGNLWHAQDEMDVALELLEIMLQNVVPLLRHLSVNRYQDIRGSLGITSGSGSPNIKHALFSELYELFVAAAKLRAMELEPYTEESLSRRLSVIAEDPGFDSTTHSQYALLRCANRLHLILRTHRDLHIQFVKTQIGMPGSDAKPNVSTSGAPNAIRAAHGMRHGAHGTRDAVIPVFEALLGKEFPAVAPFAGVFPDRGAGDSFVCTMLVNTAEVVAKRSDALQKRVLERKRSYGNQTSQALELPKPAMSTKERLASQVQERSKNE